MYLVAAYVVNLYVPVGQAVGVNAWSASADLRTQKNWLRYLSCTEFGFLWGRVEYHVTGTEGCQYCRQDSCMFERS